MDDETGVLIGDTQTLEVALTVHHRHPDGPSQITEYLKIDRPPCSEIVDDVWCSIAGLTMRALRYPSRLFIDVLEMRVHSPIGFFSKGDQQLNAAGINIVNQIMNTIVDPGHSITDERWMELWTSRWNTVSAQNAKPRLPIKPQLKLSREDVEDLTTLRKIRKLSETLNRKNAEHDHLTGEYLTVCASIQDNEEETEQIRCEIKELVAKIVPPLD
jgi:hypothetical protein